MTTKNPIEDLKEIRKIMEQSTKFLSLSGISGVFAGLIALGGSFWAWMEIRQFENLSLHYYATGRYDNKLESLELKLGLIALLILVSAISTGVLFTWLKARKQKRNLFTKLSFKLAISLMVPLAFGGAFTLCLYKMEAYTLVAPATLIFYGLALLNASKYVHVDIKYLALSEMALAVICMYRISDGHYGEGLYFWAFGFGVLHIVYGTIMYFKYDRKAVA
ncbi:MAG: hypothetical protein MI810_19355 [Flavobacteriales bacterium]|nr:hypothetical protein [Flavobacteriales bacterium]